MAITAAQANLFSVQALAQDINRDVTDEIRNAEQAIRSAISIRQAFKVSFFANIIGNPPGNPNTVTLSVKQQQFFDHYVAQGYAVNIDTENGNWLLDWS